MGEEQEPHDERDDREHDDKRRNRLDGADQRAPVALARVHRRELTPAALGPRSGSLGDRADDEDHDDDRHDHGERVEQQAKGLALAAQRVQHAQIM